MSSYRQAGQARQEAVAVRQIRKIPTVDLLKPETTFIVQLKIKSRIQRFSNGLVLPAARTRNAQQT